MKVAIIGATGRLGKELVNVFGTNSIPVTHEMLDITNPTSVESVLMKLNPTIVINAAVYHPTDLCELHPDRAFLVNTVALKYLADVCNRLDATLVFVSTDYVFNGEKGAPYLEDDRPNPINIYGLSKFMGERIVCQYAGRYYIIRTSAIFGGEGKHKTLVDKIVTQLRDKGCIRMARDVVISPTYVKDVANMVKDIVSNMEPGLFHCANSGYVSCYEFTKHLMEVLNIKGEVVPVELAELNLIARRPKFSALGSNKIRMPDWRDAIHRWVNSTYSEESCRKISHPL